MTFLLGLVAFATALAIAGCTATGTSAGGNPPATPHPPIAAPTTTSAAQQPIPSGMQAVDALGVEIFVPRSLTLDPPCMTHSVSRPAGGLTYAIGCMMPTLPVIWIGTAAGPATWIDPPPESCANSVVLDGEAGCLTVTTAPPNTNPDTVTAIIIWPKHSITVSAEYPAGDEAKALAVARSAHWVPVDRHGCAARQTSASVVPADAATLPRGPVLPDDPTSIGLCWYVGGRLGASATLPGNDARELSRPGLPTHAPGLSSVADRYTPSPKRPSCAALGEHSGIVFQSTLPNGTVDVAAAQFADCRGGQFFTNGTYAVPANERLASAVQRLAGFLLVFGYED